MDKSRRLCWLWRTVSELSRRKSFSIDMANCIRCGICHDACPKGAVRFDSDKCEMT
ncbi:MAG: hypothetical protein DRQ02_11375 [Candidatus Latescibacterota bacterium]|nr:MAG: hypothetical protein DRQ02_11375 [Candidatus Latescibacterota bacterium]